VLELGPILGERGSAISANAAASCPKCSISQVEAAQTDRAQRGGEAAEVLDRFHLMLLRIFGNRRQG
jgi:hypothetical protein